MSTPKHTPWRVVSHDGIFQVWTVQYETPGSRNNYVVADGIQTEDEARLLAAAPDLLKFAETVRTQAEGDLSAIDFRAQMHRLAVALLKQAKGEA